jgi:hypothetical protein
MLQIHGLVDHDYSGGLLVHCGLVAKMGGALTGVGLRRLSSVWLLPVRL